MQADARFLLHHEIGGQRLRSRRTALGSRLTRNTKEGEAPLAAFLIAPPPLSPGEMDSSASKASSGTEP